MDINKKKKINDKLKDRYRNDIEYREKKKRIAIEHYYAKKYNTNQEQCIKIIQQPITLYFN